MLILSLKDRFPSAIEEEGGEERTDHQRVNLLKGLAPLQMDFLGSLTSGSCLTTTCLRLFLRIKKKEGPGHREEEKGPQRQYRASLASPVPSLLKIPFSERQEGSPAPLRLLFIHLQNSCSLKLHSSGFKFQLFVALLITSSIFPRKDCIFTIDPSTARDLDDALSCKSLADGRMGFLYTLGGRQGCTV